MLNAMYIMNLATMSTILFTRRRERRISTYAYELSNKMEQEFTLIACMSSSTLQGALYIDNGASFRMTWVRNYFSSYREENIPDSDGE